MRSKTQAAMIDRLENALSKQGVFLKKSQLIEIAAEAFGHRNSNAFIAAAKAGELDPPKAIPIGRVKINSVDEVIILRDPVTHAPYGIDRSFIDQVSLKERGEAFGPTPYGSFIDVRSLEINPEMDQFILEKGKPYEIKCLVQHISHRHGDEIELFRNKEDELKSAAGWVEEYWNEISDDNGNHEDMTDREKVDTYFDEHDTEFRDVVDARIAFYPEDLVTDQTSED